MGRLAAVALAVVALAVFAQVVPLRGRTLAERWRDASGPGAFLVDGWRELRDPGPADAYTPAEREALERLISERGR
jgi:hypothetical protein